ncbi:glutathione S-transferase [Truncatella angustata]|uniref:glutathione transferase n=1 Tax=Truncatella angustata TaxID=152316 RepID=A0A9P9A0F6_9PEZI|nr:glutathione S-transferase [Truncatella angustata]KAH6655959.1 glutathione S-transferase [Truncatella angustata]
MSVNPLKPIRILFTPPGPNPWNVNAFLVNWSLLSERERYAGLGLKYEIESFSWAQVKKKPFIDFNPNGRVPAIEDPNTDLTLWESGAIYQYPIEHYNINHRLSYETLKERHISNQWLHFQMSGQGPYYGQCVWCRRSYPKKIKSAIDRYANEIERVIGVLESVLAAKPPDAQWLVGDNMTFADMAFVPWNVHLSEVLQKSWDEDCSGIVSSKASSYFADYENQTAADKSDSTKKP